MAVQINADAWVIFDCLGPGGEPKAGDVDPVEGFGCCEMYVINLFCGEGTDEFLLKLR